MFQGLLLELESSNHLYMPTDEDNGSGSTVRVDSNGIEINSGVFLNHFFHSFSSNSLLVF